MPAAAVIPAPIVYTKFVAVGGPVVVVRSPGESRGPSGASPSRSRVARSAVAVRREASTARRLPVLSEAPAVLG